jgi:hypothetical protein
MIIDFRLPMMHFLSQPTPHKSPVEKAQQANQALRRDEFPNAILKIITTSPISKATLHHSPQILAGYYSAREHEEEAFWSYRGY